MSTNVIQLPNATKVYGSEGIVSEVVTITPKIAADWLRCNKNNRPVRRNHVAFLASEITNGNWQVNGQAIIISEDEEVLDGQHRLFAIIESGKAVQSFVVYGITPEAFRTIDTGAVRTGADALFLHLTDVNSEIVKAAATAARWCISMDRGVLREGAGNRISNTRIIEYVKAHMSLLQCATELTSYKRDMRPVSLGCGTALLEMFSRKQQDMAHDFMQKLYTGESIERTDVEYVLRGEFIKDSSRTRKMPLLMKVRMIIKGWNWRRRGMTSATQQVVIVQPSEDPKVIIL